MTEAQMELIAARAADIAVAKFRTMLQSELNAVINGVASLDPAFIDEAMSNWLDREVNKTMQRNGGYGQWVPAEYTIVEKLAQAMGNTPEFKTQLHNVFRNVRF